jgi:hypothetical protein
VTIALPWYSSAAFWGAAGVVVIVAVGAATVLVTYAVGVGKRQLTYAMVYSSSLLGPAGSLAVEDLKVVFRGEELRHPHLVMVRLDTRGRRDIRSEDFDQGRPLVLDLGARIVGALGIASIPNRPDTPKLEVDGRTLKVGPDLIRMRQSYRILLLVDGLKPHLTCSAQLGDVEVHRQRADEGLTALTKYLTGGAFIFGVGCTALSLWLGGLNSKPPTSATVLAVVGLVAFVAGFGSSAYQSGARRARRYR